MVAVKNLLSNDIKKPTALVHFEREMSPTEQKVMTLLIFHCQCAQKDEKGFYYIRKSFVRRFLGWDDSNNYPRIYQAFEKIFDNSIKWNFLGADKTFRSLKCKLIVSLLEPTETGEVIGFRINPDLEPVIKDPKVFAKVKLIMMSILAKPKYAFSFYEIVADFYSRGEKIVQIPLSILRAALGIKGPYYENYVAFKKEVLKPNISAINKNTDYEVTFKTYREERKVAGLIVSIEKQPWQPPFLLEHIKELQSYYQESAQYIGFVEESPLGPAEQQFIEDMARYHITQSDARKALKAHGLQGASEIRDYVLTEVERRRGTVEEVRDLGAYLAHCLRGGFGKKAPEEREQAAATQARLEDDARRRATREYWVGEAKRIQEEFWSQQAKWVDEHLAGMTPSARSELERRFARNHIWGRKFLESGLKTPGVCSAFYHFAAAELLTEAQRDLLAFAACQGTAPEIIRMLESNTL